MQPEVSAHVDDDGAGGQPVTRVLRCDRVGQGGEHHLRGVGFERVLDAQLDIAAWHHVAVARARVTAPHDAHQLDARVVSQQGGALHADVPGRTGDSGAHPVSRCHPPEYTDLLYTYATSGGALAPPARGGARVRC